MWIRKKATSVPGLVFAGRQLQPMVTTRAAAWVPSNHSSVTLNNLLWCAHCLCWEQPRSGRQTEGAGKETGNKNYYIYIFLLLLLYSSNILGNTRYKEKLKKYFLSNIICCTRASREGKISLQMGYNPYWYSKWNYQAGKDHVAVKIKVWLVPEPGLSGFSSKWVLLLRLHLKRSLICS